MIKLINEEFLRTQPIDELKNISNPKNLLASDVDGNLYLTDYSNLTSKILSGVKGEATPTSSPTPWNTGDPDLFEKWEVKTPGTYTNFKDNSDPPQPIEVTTDDLDEKIVQIWVTNGVSKLEILTMPKASQNISNFEDLNFPVIEGTQSVYKDKLWQVKPGQTVTINDKPNTDETSKWTLIGESVTNKITIIEPVKTDSYTGNSYFINANSFSGFGFDFGIQKNFNQVIIKVGQIVGTSNPVTEVNIRICEGSYSGIELARVTKAVTIAEGEIQDVAFDLPTIITNATNSNIWFEFWTNGKTGLFKGNMASVNYRYKTTTMSYTDFSVQSTASSGPNIPLYLVLNSKSYNEVIKDSLITDQVEIDNELPVKSTAVAKKLLEYDEVIVDGYNADNTSIKGNTNINVQTSTFKGWGQLLGVLKDFNRVGYIFRAFDASLIPTQVRCVIRKSSNEGEVIFNQTKPVKLQLNTNKTVYFDLPEIYENIANDEIFVSFFADGMIALIGGLAATDFDAAHITKYTTTSLSYIVNSPVTNLRYQLYCEIIKGEIVKQISETESQRIALLAGGYEDPDLLLTSRVWLYPGAQYHIYDRNVCVPKFGDNLNNVRFNYNGSVGKQTAAGFLYDNIAPSLNTNITLDLFKGRKVLYSKTQLLLSAALTNGAGINRKLYIIGDSTVNGTATALKTIFEPDTMDITLSGTQGSAGANHEGRPGWRVSDFYGPGRTFYQINVTNIVTPPGINARYSQGTNVYNVEEVNISNGYFSISIVSGTAPTVSGTLTKISGNGDATINYASMIQTPGNKFYDPGIGKFSFSYYLSTNSLTISDDDYVVIQLGINDMFGFIDLPSAETKAEEIITQLNYMISNIHAYNPNIRIGIVITIPPADSQDAFGESYTMGQTREMYVKTGLVTLQKRLITEYDNATSLNNKVYVLSAHTNIDTVNNFPTISRPVNSRNPTVEIVQSNGVHPAQSGYEQNADIYAGFIKYFG